MVSGENESINVNENRNGKFLIVPLTVSIISNVFIIVNGIRVMCGCSTKTRVIVSLLISFAALVLFTSVFGAVAKKSSSSAPAFPNDVVLVDRVSGVWYNQLTVSYEQETSAREVNEDEAQITVYYVERPEIREEIYAESSLPKNFSFPQVLIVNNSHQNYLLKHSRIQFNFSIENPSNYSASAKICQFSTLADYESIVDKADTNKSVIEAEKKGECQQIQKPPNNFVIHKSGYYWCVVSTLLSESKNVRTSYEYRLSKLYFDKASLGQSHDCLLSEPSTRECVVANSLFSQTSTKQVLVSVAVTNTEFSSPYKVTVNKKYAIGIALIPFAILELPALVAFISLSVYCVHKYCCQRCH